MPVAPDLEASPKDLPKEAGLTEEQASRLINSMLRAWHPLHAKMEIRQRQFDSESPPRLMPPLDKVTYQSDLTRRKWVELSNRMCENPVHFKVDAPRMNNPFKEDAENLAEVLNAGIYIGQERVGYNYQHALADGQIVKALGILHWRRAWETYPPVPEAEYLDVLPEGRAADFRRSSLKSEKAKGKYKELPDSVEKRSSIDRARAGWPYIMEVIYPEMYAEREDIRGLSMAVVVKRIPLIEYDDEVQETSTDDTDQAVKKMVEMTTDFKVRFYEGETPVDRQGQSYLVGN